MKSTMRRTLRGPTLAMAALLSTGCLDDDITGTRPISITVTADVTTATVGQTITFSFAVTGTGLTEVNFAFGDGATDQHLYTGPVEASGRSTHAYAAAGSYDVVAEVIAAAGAETTGLTITVN